MTWFVFGIPLCIGVIMGMLYALSGFSDPGKGAVLSSNPRVKNLVWVATGAIGVLLTDWKIFTDAGMTAAERGIVAATYLAAVSATSLLMILFISTGIYFNARRSRAESLRAGAFDLMLIFLMHGYKSYVERKDLAAKRPVVEELVGNIGVVFSTAIACTIRDTAPNVSVESRQLSLDRLMDAAVNVVLVMAGSAKPQLKMNYMVAVDVGRLGGESDATPPFFAYGDQGRYRQYLVLRRYREGQSAAICLPVEPRNTGTKPLPGAPDAYFSGDFRLINARSPPKCDFLPAKTQGEINKFFKSVGFASVLSIPILQGSRAIGVLNIESSMADLVDQGPQMVQRVASALTPFSLLIGEIVGAMERADG